MPWTDGGILTNTYGDYGTGLVNLNIEDRLLFVHRGGFGDVSLWYQLFEKGKWQGDKKLPKHTSSNGSALVMLQGSCFAIHRGAETDERLYSAQFVLEREQWYPDTALPDAFSSSNPAAVEFKIGKTPVIFVVHRGWQSDQTLWYTQSDGHGWTKDAKIENHYSSDGPALVVYKDLVYCLHRGAHNDRQIYMTTFDGKTWSADAALPDHHTGYLPADWGGGLIGAAVYKEKIHMVHKGDGADWFLWHSHYNGTTWSTDTKLTVNGSVMLGDGISMAVMNDVLYLCYLKGRTLRYLTYTE